ncbi:glycosyltransferase family 4 protein [Flavobacterium sp.]|uniref:glycosyltransferase family 4 protein n=1 Tax=Flavobacterium sp. TaxID=239 RepID=UPI0028BF33A1|nr:glycosyltransferase family 4 protein [Flavobacterium sp.]
MQHTKKNLRVAFLTATDPNDKRSWSGIHYCMLQELRQHFLVVESIGPIDNLLLKSLGVVNKITRLVFKKGYNHNNSILRSYLLSLVINKKLKRGNYEVIFAPAASTEVAFLKTDLPILYFSDSSFGQLNGYYPVFSDLFDFSRKESNYIEQKAIDKAAFFVYPSRWAANYVAKEYGVSEEKLAIIPFGANVEDQSILYMEKQTGNNRAFNLLFLGVNWERKGGDIVYKTFLLLKEKGYNVTLTVCGCVPPFVDDQINIIPFLNKNLPEHLEHFKTLMQETHLLFVPTKADCSPIVFCEANAFGIPVLTNNTGGVSELVIDDFNGYALNMNSRPEDYALKIETLLQDADLYSRLSQNSRSFYLKDLNWGSWGKKISDILYEIKKL